MTQQRIWLAIVFAAIGFGTGGVATRAAFDQGVEPYALVLLRTVIAAAAVAAFLLLRDRRLPRGGVWHLGSLMAALNLAVPFILFTLAFQYASAGFVSLLAALFPLTTAVLANFLLPDEPLSVAKTAGLTLALVGVAILLASGDSGLAEGGRPLLAFALGIGAVLSISFAGVYAKRYAHHYDPMAVTGIQFALGALLVLLATIPIEGTPGGQSVGGWLLIAYLALFSSVAPFLLYYWLLRRVSTTKASLIGYLVPIVAVITGVVFLDEQVQGGIVAGGALILAGVIVTDRIELRGQRSGAPTAAPPSGGGT
jgi:drug/metabolite transporter (DMT)-like permease